MFEPFFSICIPATDREKTIFNTLKSVYDQTFKDYELIVTLRDFPDKTEAEIERFFSQYEFSENINIRFEKIDEKIKTVEDWNDPLKLANGKYIAMLEGDDQFESKHLQKAYDFLSRHENIGIYATGNQHNTLMKQGYISSGEYMKHTFFMNEVPPPSQTIFRRRDKKDRAYMYNSEDYIYAPEIDLYMRISLDGYDTYQHGDNTVYRDPSTNVFKGVGWKYLHDRVMIVKKYKQYMSVKNVLKVKYELKKRMLVSFLVLLSKKKELDWNLLLNMVKF